MFLQSSGEESSESSGRTRSAWLKNISGLMLVVGIGIVLGIILGFSMLAVAVTIIKRRRCRHPQFDASEQRSMICQTKLEDVTMSHVYNEQSAASDVADSIYYRTYESRVIPPPPPPGTAYCSTMRPVMAADTAALCGPPSPTQTASQLRHYSPASLSQPCDVVRGSST